MPRQNCNSMPVFAVTVYSVFTIDYTKNKAVSSRIANSIEVLTNIKYKRLYFLYFGL